MNRFAVLICLIFITVFSGCTMSGGIGDKQYYVYATSVDKAPPEATIVNRSSEHVADLEPIQRAISKAERQNGSQVRVNESEYDRIRKQFQTAPVYTSDGDRWYNSTGLYIHTNETIVRVCIGTQTPA